VVWELFHNPPTQSESGPGQNEKVSGCTTKSGHCSARLARQKGTTTGREQRQHRGADSKFDYSITSSARASTVVELLAKVPIAASLGRIGPIPAHVDRPRRRHSIGGDDGAKCDTVKDGPVVGLLDPRPHRPHDRGGFHGHPSPAHCNMGPTGCDASMSNCDVPGSDRDASMSGRDVTSSGDASMPNRDVTSSDDASMPNRDVTGHPDISTECGGFDSRYC
jgi:hypothetical protein